MTETIVITCPECEGLTFSLTRCQCVSGGDRILIPEQDAAQTPYRECQLCQGAGGIAQGCVSCRQRGRRRAQLVITVANLDTGRVASRNVVPGSLEPTRAAHGGWRLSLDTLLTELADAVGARQVAAVNGLDNYHEMAIELPRWRPDLPVETRHRIEAAAIAALDNHPWWVYVGRSTPARPQPDPDQRLRQLCQIADQLCLDLVVEARHQSTGRIRWDVRYEVPGARVPASPDQRDGDLPSAIATTTVASALNGLAARSLGAPAHRIRPPADPSFTAAPRVDCDRLARGLCAPLRDSAIGGQAIWRNGRWWYTRLKPGRSTTVLRERETGQISQHTITALHREWEPPAPAWLGDPLPYIDCPDCAPDNNLRRCHCTMGAREPEPDCAACAGTGHAPGSHACPTCRDDRRLHLAVQVTVTDLRGRVRHHTWQPALGEPVTLVGTQLDGRPVYAVPARYRLARWAHPFAVRPEDLTELDTGHEIGQDLREGTVTVSSPTSDPVIEYVLAASRGLPAARLLVLAAVPDAPSLVETIRLAHGLRLGIAISIENHRRHAKDPTRLHGERWQVDITSPDQPTAQFNLPLAPSLEAALAACHEYLENTLRATIPDDPTAAIHVPQTPVPATVTDPTAIISRLGYHYAGQAVTVHLQASDCRIYLHEPHGPQQLAHATTLIASVTALGLRPI